ncbi:MAG TPA: hypothetical protein PLV87_08495 [Opitutaceae bacterium]|jgi:hypothetical protein|nr:hypothetical protein [Opitutaceae bacterium]
MSLTKPMPVKLSGELVEEARSSARLFHRSLTGQIEHWAAIGRAVEAQLPGDTLTRLMERVGGTMKIGQVADAAQRQQVMTVLVEFLGQTTGDVAWLREISARGVPLYGTEAGNLVRLNPDGSRETVQAMTAATAG